MQTPPRAFIQIGLSILCVIAGIGLAQNVLAGRLPCSNKPTKAPTVQATDTVCLNDPSPDLTALVKPDSASYQILWSQDGGITYSAGAPSLPTSSVTTFTVSVKQALKSDNTCFGPATSFTVTIRPKPQPPTVVKRFPGDASNHRIFICEGFSVNLSDSIQHGGTLRWYAIDASGTQVPFSGMYTAKFVGRDTLFYVQQKYVDSCFSDPLVDTVSVLPRPLSQLRSDKGFQICDSLPIPFTAEPRYQGYNPTYDWYVNGVLVKAKGGPGYTIKAGTFRGPDSVIVNYVIHIDKFAPYYHCDSVGTPSIGRPFGSETLKVKILPKPKAPPIYGPTIVYAGQKNMFYKVPLDTTLFGYKWNLTNIKYGVVTAANNTALINYSDSLNFSSNRELIDTLILTVKNVCDSAKSYLVIHIRPYLRPINILTPNGDNTNDTWVIDNIDNDAYINNEVFVYDRFGNLVYNRKNYRNATAWNGTMAGRPLSEGTYYYILTYKVDATHTMALKGFITLLRK